MTFMVGARRVPTLENTKTVSQMVLLRLKKSAASFRRRPVRGHDNTGGIVLPDPWPEGKRCGSSEGRFSAGSRDCRGGGGQPPLHVRVREKHIWRGCHGERNAFTDAAYFHTPAIFPSERAKARQRRARYFLNRYSPSHLRKIQRRHAFNIRGVKYPLLVRRKRRVRVRHLTVAVEHFP